ncbi:MAG: ferrous iron transport protein A [Planctomycetaceae bacterium]|jgi:Fe2+ transport system protein FeoA|nr:ferrous iron transport protein A [Planctomycetaceae bacterium]
MTDATPQPERPRIPLTQLGRGQRARLDAGCMSGLPEHDQCLLRAMGVHEHCELRVCKPGEPCIIQVERTKVGLSGPVANQLLVTPCDDPGAC